MKHALKFPLFNQFTLTLPEGTRIASASITADVANLNLEDFPDLGATCNAQGVWIEKGTGRGLPSPTYAVRVYMEGEKVRGGAQDGAEIPIPNDGDPAPGATAENDLRLRKLGVLVNAEPPATFHVFTEEKPSVASLARKDREG